MAKETKQLLFNKKTGVLIGDIPLSQSTDKLNLEKFQLKTVEIDPVAEYWDGDYSTGSVKTVDMTTRFSESSVNLETTQEIEQKYDLYKQLKIIREAIKAIGGDSLPADFTDMCTHIEDCITKGNTKKTTYKDNDAFDYVSNEDLASRSTNATDFN